MSTAAPSVASPETTGNQASERSARSTAQERLARAQPLESRPPCMLAPFASLGGTPPRLAHRSDCEAMQRSDLLQDEQRLDRLGSELRTRQFAAFGERDLR